MTSTVRKISEKVVEAVHDASDKVLGMVAPKKRMAYDANVAPGQEGGKPSRNLAVVWEGPNKVGVKDVSYPKMQTPQGDPIEHGVILKVVATAICGSDLHMYRGHMAGVKPGMRFGHEITGQVFEMGSAVERFEIGDFVSVPFNISCGKCDNCREQKSSACLRANPEMPGAAYGFAMMGGWDGGQSEYVLVPWADFSLLKLPKEAALPKIRSLAFLSDIFPTGYNGALQAGVKAGSIVYVAGAGPVGLCCARACLLLGAAEVFVADQNADRLKNAASIGCKTIDLTKLSGGKTDSDSILAEITRQLPPWKNGPHTIVDCAIDCVGWECCGVGREANKHIDEQVLNTMFKITKAGGGVSAPGIYALADPTGPNADNKEGVYHMQYGVAWNKAISIAGGQCPVLSYNKDLMKTILHDKVDLGPMLNVKVISLAEAPEAYKRFNEGEPCKYVIDPHGMLSGSAGTSTMQTK